jgi:N-acyl-D-aspartate/D-glutamate deacylase
VTWDDMLAPSVYHGVTTVLAGNCGFTLAPLSGRADDIDYLLGILANVEGMPVRALKAAVKPSWQGFGEYLDCFDGKIAINTAFMDGHTALRRCVMGERAVGHEANSAELAAQRPVNWNALFVDVRRRSLVDSQLAMGHYAKERGAKGFGLTPATALKAILNFRTGFPFAMLDGWKPFLRLPIEEKIQAMKNPAYRAGLQQGAEDRNNPAQPLSRLDTYRIEDVHSERNARWRQRPLRDYAAEVGLPLFDALFNLAVEEELWLTFAGPELGADEASWELRRQVWEDEHILLGGSDAGAHLDMFNTFALTTQLLSEGVRERGILSLEQGVRRITSELADAFGLKGRGRIEAGAAADLVVFDPDTIGCGRISMRNDLPGNEARLYGDAIGIHHVIVNGIPVAAGNQPTGRKGSRVLRSGRDTFTVALQ